MFASFSTAILLHLWSALARINDANVYLGPAWYIAWQVDTRADTADKTDMAVEPPRWDLWDRSNNSLKRIIEWNTQRKPFNVSLLLLESCYVRRGGQGLELHMFYWQNDWNSKIVLNHDIYICIWPSLQTFYFILFHFLPKRCTYIK